MMNIRSHRCNTNPIVRHARRGRCECEMVGHLSLRGCWATVNPNGRIGEPKNRAGRLAWSPSHHRGVNNYISMTPIVSNSVLSDPAAGAAHIRIVLSRDPEMKRVPSGENATDSTPPRCPFQGTPTGVPEMASHICTVLSPEPEMM